MENKHVKKENGSQALAISNSVRTQRPGNYLFKIESFSLLLDAITKTKSDKYESPHFDAGGYKWKLSLYPNGDKKRGVDGYISLYLALADPKSLPQGGDIHVYVNFFVHDYVRDNYLVLHDGKEKRFHALKTEWGLEKLIPLEIFTDPSQGYLVDDFCSFGTEIFINEIERQGELFQSKRNMEARECTFIWKVNKFSTLPEIKESEVFCVGSVKWTLILYPKGDSRAKGTHLSLFLSVHGHSSFPSGWNIYAESQLSILDQMNEKYLDYAETGDWFSATDGTSWGYAHFMRLTDLENASTGYLLNNAVVIKVKLMCVSFTNHLT